jgi:EmrB/QacA subfamily drug resistance transporter
VTAIQTEPVLESESGGLSPRQLHIVLAGLILALFLSALDNTIVGTALPTIVGEFQGFSRFTWVTTAYLVTSTISTLLLGKLSDLYGRRLVFLFAISLFLIGSLLCGIAQSMDQLILFRAAQGLGGGGIWALTFAVVGDIVPARERGKYFGLFTSVWGVSSIAGPLIGGVIVDNVSWRWVFLVNLPLGAAALAVIATVLKLPFTPRKIHIDWLGGLLVVISIGALMVDLEEGSTLGWSDSLVIILFLVALVTGVCFFIQESRSPEPILPLRLFKNGVIRLTMTLGLLVGTMMMTAGLFFALYFQDVRFYSPTRSGLATLPMMAGMLLASTTVGRMISASGTYKRFPIVGFPLSIAGLIVSTSIKPGSSFWILALGMFLIGLGMGSVMPTLSIASQNSADPRDMGIATSAQNFFRSLGSSIGLAVYGTIFNSVVRSELTNRLPKSEASSDLLSIIRQPSEIQKLAPAARNAVQVSISKGASHIFFLSVFVGVVAFLLAFRLREEPLRSTTGLQQRAAMSE